MRDDGFSLRLPGYILQAFQHIRQVHERDFRVANTDIVKYLYGVAILLFNIPQIPMSSFRRSILRGYTFGFTMASEHVLPFVERHE